MSLARRVAAAFALAVFAAGGAARADDTRAIESLLSESVVSTASQEAETSSMAPATTVVVTAEELRLYGAQTVQEALPYLVQGFTSLSGPNEESEAIRGVVIPVSGAAQVLWLLNGHRVNTELRPTKRFELPIDLVDRVEVVLGPGSVLYGSNAMQAVINVITKAPATLQGARVGVDSWLPYTVRPWATAGTTFELFGSKGGVAAGVQHFGKDGPGVDYPVMDHGVDPATGQPYRFTSDPVGTGIWGGRMRRQTFERKTSAFVQTTLGELKLDVQAQVAKSPIFSSTVDFDARSSWMDDRALRVDLAYGRRVSPIVHVSERLYLDGFTSELQHQSSRAPVCGVDGGTCLLRVYEQALIGGAEVQGRFDWMRDGLFTTLVGVDARLRRVQMKTDHIDAATGQPFLATSGLVDRGAPLVGAYAQQIWEPLRWLGLNAGARLDVDPRFDPVLSPRQTVRVRPWDGGTLKLMHAQAYRAPSFFESDFAVSLAPKNPDLKPEHVHGNEASFEQRFGSHRWAVGVFRNTFENLIEFHEFTGAERAAFVAANPGQIAPLFQHGNVSRVSVLGFDLAVSGALVGDRLKYGLSITEADARFEQGGVTGPLEGAPRLSGNARVSYDLGGGLPTVGLATSFYDRTLTERALTGGFDPVPYAPAQLEGRLVVAGAVPLVPRLSFRAYVSAAAADRSPILVGPMASATEAQPGAFLMPVHRFRAFAGLAYEL